MNDEIALELLNSIKLKSGKFSEKSISIHYKDLYDYIMNRFNEEMSINESYYLLKHHLESIPKCPVCGKRLHLVRGKNFEFSKYCSIECKRKLVGESISQSYKNKTKEDFEFILDKRKKTCLEKYGTEFVAQVDEFKEKTKQTCLEKYGTEYSFQSSNNKKKSENTKIEKYGSIENANNTRIQHTRKSCLEKYGYETYFVSNEYKEKCDDLKHLAAERRWKSIGFDIKYYKDNLYHVYNQCNKHHVFDMDLGMLNNRLAQHVVLCPICNPPGSVWESSQEKLITDLLDKYNIKYEKHNRKIIKHGEIDIYIPDFKLGIECDGVYWHSDKFLDNNYHLNKTKICKEQGIQLLHIWEDSMFLKKDIVFDIIKSKLGLNNKIYARKCVIKEVSSKDSKKFLDENHLQGNINASIRLGLYYNDELVSIMTFGKLRKSLGMSSDNEKYELYRFSNKKGINVIGAAGKLLSYFKKNYVWKEIISFANRDISDGNLYYKLGFELLKETKPNYYWVNKKTMIRENRFKYRKSEISNEYNKDKSENDIMKENGYFKCYNTGNLEFIMKNIKKEE